MSRSWNWKALIDDLGVRLWDTSSAFRTRIIYWANEIQDDLVSEKPLDYYKFRLKKLLPTEQEIISLNIQKPSAPTVAVSSGGSLTDGSAYKVLVTFLVWDEDNRHYMESEPSVASSAASPTGANLQIDLTAIDTMDGDTSVRPATIWRRIYLQELASGETSYAEPFYVADIEDDTTTTYTITAEPSSTITPPSDSELDQLDGDNPFFLSSGKYLAKESMTKIRRFNPQYSESDTPSYFDHVGQDRINLYPRLSSSATTAQRTLVYHVHRRPHEAFYDIDRKVDMPITFRKALIQGIIWKAYEFRDRDGKESELNKYQEFKKEAQNKSVRQRTRPGSVRDVMGGTMGYEV